MKVIAQDSKNPTSDLRPRPEWPTGFDRIPGDDWVRRPVDESALKYERAGTNAFSKNWDPTIAQVLAVLDESKVLVDYSSGTGIFTEHLLGHVHYATRILNVDVSPRYLRVAVDKFRDDERVALRLLKRLDDGRRFQSIDEVVGDALLNRGLDVLTSTNAIHLYLDLPGTLESWQRVLRPGGLLLINTGDMDVPNRGRSGWRLHDTITKVNEIAQEVVRVEPIFEKYRQTLENCDVMNSYAELRRSVYPPIKSIEVYLDALSDADLKPLQYFEQSIDVSADEMSGALFPYHDVVLGWIGGSKKVEGRPPTSSALGDRLFLIRYCVEKLFGGRDYLHCPWTYITCRR